MWHKTKSYELCVIGFPFLFISFRFIWHFFLFFHLIAYVPCVPLERMNEYALHCHMTHVYEFIVCVCDVRWKGIGTNVIFDLATGQTWPPRHVNVFIRFSKCFVGASCVTCRTSSPLLPKRRDSDYELFAYKCNTVSALRSHAQWLSTNDYCICVCAANCNMQHSSLIDSNWKSPQHIRKWMKCAISNRYNVVVRVHKAQTHAPTTHRALYHAIMFDG